MADIKVVLVIDDESNNFDVIEGLLFQESYNCIYAANGLKALNRINSINPDIILLDVMMPELDGIEVCRRIRADPLWCTVPIIMVTALSSKGDLARCLEAGADDFISKPVDGLELRARIRSLLRIRLQQQEINTLNKNLLEVNETLSAFNSELETRIQERTVQLQKMISYDSLTELPSREFLLNKINDSLRNILIDPTQSFALLYIDCDQFKVVNGSLGYNFGNKLLVAIAQRLKQELLPGDVLARLGEDEFCIYLEAVKNLEFAESTASRIQECFHQPFIVSGHEIFLSACIGLVLSHPEYQQPQDPLQDADTAMYQAKAKGKGSLQVFDQEMHKSAFKRLQLERDLQHALERKEFVTFFQPIINLSNQSVIGFEALIRWIHPEKGMISPLDFIPYAEETGLIVPIGLQVLQQACMQLEQWQKTFNLNTLTMSVNLSVKQFSHPTLLEDIDKVLSITQLDPATLKLEITESAIVQNRKSAIEITNQIRSRKIELAIDDFGTGYSSLSYLKHFPVNYLKIDRSFVRDLGSDPRNREIVRTIITLGQGLGIKLIAEGIEELDQLNILCELKCDFAQGFYFSKPMNADQATPWLMNKLGR